MTNVCAVFDIGKTNKKLFLFDENYTIVYQKSEDLEETIDEDGDTCENLYLLTKWILTAWNEVLHLSNFEIKAVNFSTYGATLAFLDRNNKPLTPLYNYLKPISNDLQKQFYDENGGEEIFAVQSASPILGHLNSAMQLYRIKRQKPEVYKHLKYALHLPQYVSSLFTNKYVTDITSVGCHTNFWDFTRNKYHNWVEKEKLFRVIPEFLPCDEPIKIDIYSKNEILAGIGIHDSSSALVPYLQAYNKPFLLISTGTWCISMNPFNNESLTYDELKQDCLCYLTYQGKPVKASRLFAGQMHEDETKKIANQYNLSFDFYKEIKFSDFNLGTQTLESDSSFDEKYAKLEYFIFMQNLVNQQVKSCNLVIQNSPVKHIFVDGGFSKNDIFMNLLALAYPNIKIFAAKVSQASALGAALVISKYWNGNSNTNNLIELKEY